MIKKVEKAKEEKIRKNKIQDKDTYTPEQNFLDSPPKKIDSKKTSDKIKKKNLKKDVSPLESVKRKLTFESSFGTSSSRGASDTESSSNNPSPKNPKKKILTKGLQKKKLILF